MSKPQAPLPLKRQTHDATAITVSVVLQGLSATFTAGGTTYNSGNPTATYTFGVGTKAHNELCDLLDRAVRDGSASVA